MLVKSYTPEPKTTLFAGEFFDDALDDLWNAM